MEQNHCKCGWGKEGTHVVCIKHQCKSERCGKRDFLPGSKAFLFVLKICVQTPGLELLVALIFLCWGCTECFTRGIQFSKMKSWCHCSSLPHCTGSEQPCSPFGALLWFSFPHLWLVRDLLGLRACTNVQPCPCFEELVSWAGSTEKDGNQYLSMGKASKRPASSLPPPRVIWGDLGCFLCACAFVRPATIFWNFLSKL